MSTELKMLRQSLRQQRRRISHFQQKQAEIKVLAKMIQLKKFQQAKKIGLYLHAFGEIQTDLIIKKCFALGKQVYLPMICNMNQKLVWLKISKHQYLNKRFSHHPLGMQEPIQNRGFNVQHLDFLIMPLLACDESGTRIGMGGGYYDRTLALSRQKPVRVGLAHDFQYLTTRLARQSWDQPLDLLITPSQRYHFRRF